MRYENPFQEELGETTVLGRKPCVIVKGPPWGGAQFYGEWLLAAAKAESFWKEAYLDQDFQKQINRVCFCYIPDFGIASTFLLMQLEGNWASFVLNVDSIEGDDFTMMTAMGFFVQDGPVYRMTLPSSLTSEKVRAAILRYAKTEDSEHMLHPEHIVDTLATSEATQLENRLRAIDEFQNGTDRPSGYVM